MAVATATHNVTLPQDEQLRVIKAAAARWHIDWRTLLGVYGTETSYGTNVTTSSAGAQGPFQFEPGTARHYGLANPWDFTTSANAAARYLHELGADGDVNSDKSAKALNAYNGNTLGTKAGDYVEKVRTLGEGLPKSLPTMPDQLLPSIPNPLKAAEGFLNLVTNPQTWLRLVEMIVGAALLLMGLKSFTGGAVDPVGVVARGAAAVA
jgi:hypothetical protein